MAWSFSYNGLSFGEGTAIKVREIAGLADLPDLRTADVLRPQADGAFAGQDYMSGRVIEFELLVTGRATSTRQATLDAITEAFVPQRTSEQALTITTPTWSEVRRVECRPRRLQQPMDIDWVGAVATLHVQLEATDPRIYSNTLHSESGGLGSTSGGLDFPHTFPHAFGTVTSGSVYCTNAGIVDTFPTVTLTGPLTVPKVSNDTSGEFVQVNLTVASGETLVLDCLERTALLNGTASRTGLVQRPESDWFTLAPGSNELRLTASTGSGSMQVDWRDAWL